MRATSNGLQFCPGPGILTGDNCQTVAGTSGDWKSTYQLVAGDFNGDGTTDLILASTTNTLFCAGPGITSGSNCVVVNGTNWRNALLVAGDFNGDSTADLHIVSGGQGFLAPGGAGAADLMVSAVDGLGAAATFQYKTLSDTSVYTKGTGAVYPILDTQSPIPVVYRLCKTDGIGGNSCTDYVYQGARLGLTGRGFLGFSQIKATREIDGQYTLSTFNQTFPFIGAPASIYAYVGTQAVKKLDYAFSQKQSFESRQFPALVSIVEYNNGLDGEWKSEQKAFSFDAYGNHS